MEYLSGLIDFSKKNSSNYQKVDSTTFNSEILFLETSRNHIFNYDSENLFFDTDKNTLLVTLGYFLNIEELKNKHRITYQQDVRILSELFNKIGQHFLEDLDGLFLILFYDVTKQKIKIFQSTYGTGLPFYYFAEKDKIFFGTSLKKILPKKDKREFNYESAFDFIFYNAIIPNETTLIKGIYKLVPSFVLEFDLESKKVKKIKQNKTNDKIGIKEAKKVLLETIEKSLNNIQTNLLSDVAITHTGGWDSNLMLHYLRKFNPTNSIDTVTISGGNNLDEVATVKKIQKAFYKNINHFSSEVASRLDDFPNIVWIFEGYIFEEGMFLRYELGKLLNKVGFNKIILGATADQVLYPPNRLKRITRNFKERGIISLLKFFKGYVTGTKREENKTVYRKSLKRTKLNRDFNIDIEMLLKMHAIMLNNFNVTSLFPYLNNSTVAAGKSLRNINNNKKYYKQLVRKVLGNELSSYFDKSGSVVDSKLIFKTNQELLMQIFNNHKEFILKFIDLKTYEKLQNNPLDNRLLIMHFIYLHLFNEIFVAGKYDDQFPLSNFDQKINDFV